MDYQQGKVQFFGNHFIRLGYYSKELYSTPGVHAVTASGAAVSAFTVVSPHTWPPVITCSQMGSPALD